MILFTFERLALSARVQGDVIGFHILSNTRTLNLDISDKKIHTNLGQSKRQENYIDKQLILEWTLDKTLGKIKAKVKNNFGSKNLIYRRMHLKCSSHA